MHPVKTATIITILLFLVAAPAGAEKPAPFARAENQLAIDTGARASVVVDKATSRARLIRIPEGTLHLAGGSPTARAESFLAKYGVLLGVADTNDLDFMGSSSDRLGMTRLDYRQSYRGLPVFGAWLRVHMNPDMDVVTVNGALVPDLALSTDPAITSSQALASARVVMAKEAGLSATDLEASPAELMIYRAGLIRGIPGTNHLAWRTEISSGSWLREAVFVDAHTGRVIDRINQIHTIDREVFHRNTDTLLWSEGDATPFSGLSASKDPEVNEMIDAALDTYDLYANVSGGDFLSYDGNDATMRGIYEPDFLDCPNATWNGLTANFCVDFAVDDVIAHEWTHGYTDFNHNLIYQWQPGALNEAYSDIFGEIVDLLNERGLDSPGSPRTPNSCSSFAGTVLPVLQVTEPASAVGIYSSASATWNPESWSESGTVQLVNDGTDTVTDACEPLNGFTAGRIALIDRGGCPFRDKVLNAEAAGAIAVIVANNEDDSLLLMTGGDPPPEIPGLFIGLTSGQALKSVVDQGLEVTMGMNSSTDESVRWLTGEDIDGGSGAIRDMWNPPCFGDPGSVTAGRYWCNSGDNGGVHINSGISNHLFALLVDGGTYGGETVSPIGMTKAAHIYWRAMSVYQGQTTDFPEHADFLELSCADLIGQPITSLTTGGTISDTIDASDCSQVANAISAVDLRAEPPCDFEVVLEPNPPALPAGKTVFSEAFNSPPGSEWTITSEGVYPEYNPDLGEWRWTSRLPTGGNGGAFWAVNGFFGNCEPNDDDQSGVTHLTSPLIEIPADASGATLAFDHWVATETGWDGGNFKISVNGSDFELVPAESFIYNPYNASVFDVEQEIQNTNPLAGEIAYTGFDEGHVFGGTWGQSQIDLDALALPGDTIQLRWDFGVDGCTGFEGWYVDNVKVIAEGLSSQTVRRSGGRRVSPEGPF